MMDAMTSDKIEDPFWVTGHAPGRCTWPAHCGRGHLERPTTHAVEWPQGDVEEVEWFRTYACAEDAQVIADYQASIGTVVTVREVGEGNW
jgi:hypothetical protein